MTLTPIQVLQEASELRLTLDFEPPDTLTVKPARLCSAEFAEVLKAHKSSHSWRCCDCLFASCIRKLSVKPFSFARMTPHARLW
jgi:hypothetical protein